MSARIVPDAAELVAVLAPARERGARVALANGCFDVLHVGHVRLLQAARPLAELLVVALNSDTSARANKGDRRPLVPLAERMELIAALAGVDYVTSFDEPTAATLLARLRPEIHVKGTDWTAETVPERAIVQGYGGRVVIAGDPKTHASSDLIRRLSGGR